MSDSREGLGGRARSGLKWSLFNSATMRVLNVVTGLVIARLLLPEEFGTYAAGLVVLVALLSMNELGVSVAVVRWKGAAERVAPTAVTTALAGSLALFAAAFAGAPALASLLNAPGAEDVIRILSFGLLLDGLSTIPNAFLMRSFRQRLRAVADVVGFVTGSAVGIWLAAVGWGASGLAIGLLVNNAVATLLVWVFAPVRPRPGWNTGHARELLRSGLPPAGTSLLVLAILNIDYVVVSRVLGVEALGFYVLAFNVASWPWNLMSMAVRQVSLPAFSRLSDDHPALDTAFARGVALAAGAAVLGAVLLIALSDPLIEVLYGEPWLPAAVALVWLAVLGALRVVLDLCYDLLVAVGRAGSLLRLQVIWLGALAVALPVGAHANGIAGVALAHACVAAILVVPLHALLLARLGLRAFATAGAPACAAAAVAALAALAALRLDTAPVWTLLVVGLITTLVYVAAFGAFRSGRQAVAWATGAAPAAQVGRSRWRLSRGPATPATADSKASQ